MKVVRFRQGCELQNAAPEGPMGRGPGKTQGQPESGRGQKACEDAFPGMSKVANKGSMGGSAAHSISKTIDPTGLLGGTGVWVRAKLGGQGVWGCWLRVKRRQLWPGLVMPFPESRS